MMRPGRLGSCCSPLPAEPLRLRAASVSGLENLATIEDAPALRRFAVETFTGKTANVSLNMGHGRVVGNSELCRIFA